MSRKHTAADLITKTEAAIKKYDLLSGGDSVIIALSGGADSVTLLSVLNSIKEKYNLKLYAAHLNHGIRGEEADNDEKFCKVLCENYNVQLFVKHIDVPKLCTEQKISAELCGRNERYKFFDELSAKLNAKVATAHTASDNAETLLFNLCRGSSLAGAAAIPPKRGNIIRPLITLTRNEIESYCAENSLSYVTDSTNMSDSYTRNKIRHKVIPALKEVNPQAESAMLAFSRSEHGFWGFYERMIHFCLNAFAEVKKAHVFIKNKGKMRIFDFIGYNSECVLSANGFFSVFELYGSSASEN